MSKLSFRARPLEVSKPMPIYMSEELPDLPQYSAINRAVPQMPSGMKKEEECEHHLQRAMVTGLIIPTPEVNNVGDISVYDLLYPPDYKVTRQLIHMQPFSMEQDIPDYDMDSDDEKWLAVHSNNLEVDVLKFEEMMDRLEKNSGHSVVTQAEAKILLKEDDDLILAVYDYWLNKRLKLQQALIPCVKTETHHRGSNNNNNPYLAFRRRTEKMQTRKNRKNDESTYEKMVKLKRDLRRAATCLELVKKREYTKKEYLNLTLEIFEKRYQAQDYSGTMLAEVTAMKTSRPAFAPIFANQYNQGTTWPKPAKDEYIPRKEKRQYKKRKHKSTLIVNELAGITSSGDDDAHNLSPTSPANDEAQFVFHRRRHCLYQAPLGTGLGNWPWCSIEEGGLADQRFRFSLSSIANPKPRCVGFARRRVGRGGRVILDRAGPSRDDFWASLDFTIHDNTKEEISLDSDTIPLTSEKAPDETSLEENKPLVPDTFQDWLHFRPKSPVKPEIEEEEVFNILNSSSLSLVVEDLEEPANELVPVQLNLNELFPGLVFDQELSKQDVVETIPSVECEIEFEATSIDPMTSELFSNLTPKSTDIDLDEALNVKRVCFHKKEYQNQSGSLLDRWARCESLPPEQKVQEIKKVVTSEPFICEEATCSSAFRTCNLWRESKERTTSESSSIIPTLLEEDQAEASSVVVQELPAPPPTPPKQIKSPPPMAFKHRANNTSHSNGPIQLDLSNNRLLSKQLGSNSSYRKKNNHIHSHGRNNKLIMRLPENTVDLLDSTPMISKQVISDKNPNEALMRKSTQVAMEVT